MRRVRTLITAAAVVGAALGAGAASASAYSVSGGWYTGTADGRVRLDFAHGYTVDCQETSITGYASGSSSTDFTPTFSDCTFFGLPATVSQSGAWFANVLAGPTSGGWYYADFYIPASTTTTVNVPLAGCTVTITGSQWWVAPVNYRNVTPLGVEMEFYVSLAAYTASGCPFSSGTDGRISTTSGRIIIPGISIS